MLIQFQIEFKTFPGQQLMIVGSLPALGNGNQNDAQAMSLEDISTGRWTFRFENKNDGDFTYRYFVKDDNFNTHIEEWGPDRVFKSEKRQVKLLVLSDRWRAQSDPDFALHSSAFLNAILKPGQIFKAPKAKSGDSNETVILRFKPSIVRVKPGHRVAVCGSAVGLGNWVEKKAVSLGNPDHPLWCGDVAVPVSEFPVRYKYLIQNEKGKTEFWEKSFDRVIDLPKDEIPAVIEIGDE